jgi:DNA-binding NtrC family response regulator
MAQEALEKLMEYDFPGNVRELENVVERAFVFSEGDLIRTEDVHFDHEPDLCSAKLTPGLLEDTLEQCHWNKTRTALKLGKSRRQLYRLIEKYQLDRCIKKTGPRRDPLSLRKRGATGYIRLGGAGESDSG